MNTQTTMPPVRRTVTVKQPPPHAFALFTARIDQWWPHGAGVPAGGLAAAPGRVVLEPRPVTIHRLDLVDIPDPDHAVLEAECGKGTYVRAIARDLGRALGTRGHVSALRRMVVLSSMTITLRAARSMSMCMYPSKVADCAGIPPAGVLVVEESGPRADKVIFRSSRNLPCALRIPGRSSSAADPPSACRGESRRPAGRRPRRR